MTDTTTLEASADGKRNAHYLHCRFTGSMQPYAACLNKIAQNDAGRALSSIFKVCDFNTACPARALREEEKQAGRAIYFSERDRSAGPVMPSAPINLPKVPTTTPVLVAPSSPAAPTLGHDYMAQALTLAMRESAPVIKPEPGESLLAFAKRKKATLASL
jgi:hypothetical protein